MKLGPNKKTLTFGLFIARVYDTWGKRKAKGIVRRAVNAGWLEFRGPGHYLVS
jgi:hypothetical protein